MDEREAARRGGWPLCLSFWRRNFWSGKTCIGRKRVPAPHSTRRAQNHHGWSSVPYQAL